MNKKSKILWGLFLLSIIIIFIDTTFILSGTDCPVFFNKVKLYFPAVVVFSHIVATLKIQRGLLFIFLSSVTGLVFEIIGTRYGNFIGAGYIYDKTCYDILFFDIPLLIPIYWTLFIYTAYGITNSFLLWKNKEKPSINSPSEGGAPKGWGLLRSINATHKLILLDSFIVLSIDLFMEPILVHAGNWRWFNSGFYFDVPSMNFIGWFTVAFIVSSIFRSIEFYHPVNMQKLHYSIYFIPLIGYSSLFLLFSVMAIKIQYINLILINSFIMLPIIFLNLKYFTKQKK